MHSPHPQGHLRPQPHGDHIQGGGSLLGGDSIWSPQPPPLPSQSQGHMRAPMHQHPMQQDSRMPFPAFGFDGPHYGGMPGPAGDAGMMQMSPQGGAGPFHMSMRQSSFGYEQPAMAMAMAMGSSSHMDGGGGGGGAAAPAAPAAAAGGGAASMLGGLGVGGGSKSLSSPSGGLGFGYQSGGGGSVIGPSSSSSRGPHPFPMSNAQSSLF